MGPCLSENVPKKRDNNNNFYPFTCHVSSRIESCFGQYLGPNGKIYSAFDVHTHKTIIVKGWSKNHKWNGKMIFFCLFYWIYLCYRMHICVSQFKGWKNTQTKKRKNLFPDMNVIIIILIRLCIYPKCVWEGKSSGYYPEWMFNFCYVFNEEKNILCKDFFRFILLLWVPDSFMDLWRWKIFRRTRKSINLVSFPRFIPESGSFSHRRTDVCTKIFQKRSDK